MISYKKLMVGTAAVLLLASLFEGVGISMLIPILQSISETGTTNAFVQFSQRCFDFLHIPYGFIPLIVLFAGLVFLQYFLVGFQQYLSRLLHATMTYELRRKIFQNLMEVPLTYYYETKSGDLVSTTWVSTNNAGSLVEYVFLMLKGGLFAGIYIVINCFISLPLTLLTIFLASISYLFIIPRFKKVYHQGTIEKNLTDESNSFLHDSISGIKILKAFNNETYHQKLFDRIIRNYKKIQVRIMLNKILASFLLEPFSFLLVILILIVSVEVMKIPLSFLIVFLFIFTRIIPNVKLINSTYMQINEALPHFSKVQDLIDRSNKKYLKNGDRKIENLNDGIEFRNVSYRYPSNETDVLKDISFTINKNKVLALVGASGGGKSTLIDLILRYHDPVNGVITVDGRDLKEIDVQSWHNLLAIVDQDPYLFNDTIYNNICYGRLDADSGQVFNAAKMAYAHNFISELPDGYDTVVGNRGIKLSGGQRQRISLARALVRDPEILILDEATSSLDSESEQLIQKSINALQKKKTIIIIAHRLSTIHNADQIIVLEKGGVIESGTHGELIEKKGRYDAFLSLQVKP